MDSGGFESTKNPTQNTFLSYKNENFTVYYPSTDIYPIKEDKTLSDEINGFFLTRSVVKRVTLMGK